MFVAGPDVKQTPPREPPGAPRAPPREPPGDPRGPPRGPPVAPRGPPRGPKRGLLHLLVEALTGLWFKVYIFVDWVTAWFKLCSMHYFGHLACLFVWH